MNTRSIPFGTTSVKSHSFIRTLALTASLGLSLLGGAPAKAVTVGDMLSGLDVIIGDKAFENFRDYVSVGTNGAQAANPSEIYLLFSVTPAGLYELTYQSGVMFVGPGQIQDTRFSFDVRVITGEDKLEGNGLELLAFGLGQNEVPNLGKLAINETVNNLDGELIGSKLVSDDHGAIVSSAALSWSPPLSALTVQMGIRLDGDNEEGGGAFIAEFRQTFSQAQVPEPTTLALFALGLAGLGAVRRKKLAA